MDTVTQITLGAAIGELVLGRKVGWRAAVIGGVLGTTPDLDVFVSLGDPVSDFTYHRSATHSLFVLALASPLIAEALIRLQSGAAAYRKHWHALVFAVLMTHPLLDCFTIYGTQIFWPFSTYPVAWGTVFIIDPAYTLPMLLGVLAARALRRHPVLAFRLNALGLALATAYLATTVIAKQRANDAASQALAAAGLEDAQVMTIAGPFTSMFWRIVAVDGERYHNAYYSVWDPPEHVVTFASHDRNMELLNGLEQDWATRRLQWFSKGLYTLRLDGRAVIMSDLRMGFEPSYVFTFKLGTLGNPHTTPVATPEHISMPRDISGISWVWQRLWSPNVPAKP